MSSVEVLAMSTYNTVIPVLSMEDKLEELVPVSQVSIVYGHAYNIMCVYKYARRDTDHDIYLK